MARRGLKSILIGVFVVASLGMMPGSASAAPWYPHYDAYQDDGDKGGRSIAEMTRKAEYVYVLASFRAKGEHLYITDLFKNGRPAVARLWVGGGGPAVFYSYGRDGSSDESEFDLSYDEGQTVYLQVCTSDSANAVCTEKVKRSGVS